MRTVQSVDSVCHQRPLPVAVTAVTSLDNKRNFEFKNNNKINTKTRPKQETKRTKKLSFHASLFKFYTIAMSSLVPWMALVIFLMKIKSAAPGKAMSTKVSGGWGNFRRAL